MQIVKRPVLILIAAAVLVSLPAGAGRPDPGPETAMERIQRKMGKIRAHFSNASVRMNLDLNGVNAGGGEDETTYMRQCCSSNLKTILDASRLVYTLIDDLTGCYEIEQNPTGISGAAFFREDMRAFGKTMSDLENAPGRSDAEAAYSAATRAYNKLRTAGDELPDCTAVILPPEQSESD